MSDIGKRIHSDWYEIRQVYDNVFDLDAYLKLDNNLLKGAQSGLRLSVEEGVIQYKIDIITQAQEFIEALKFDTRHFDDIHGKVAEVSTLLFVTLIQRLFTSGLSLSRQAEVEPEAMNEVKEKDIKVIMEELKAMAAEDPNFIQRQEVKNILLQFKIYQKELEEVRRLKANIPKEKLPAFLANFQKIYKEINRKVQDNYNQIIGEEIQTELPPPPPGDLRKYNLKQAEKILSQEGEIISKLRSQFLFADAERYNTRDIFESALADMNLLRSIVAKEKGLYGLWEPINDGATVVAKGFSEELILRLGRLLANRSDLTRP